MNIDNNDTQNHDKKQTSVSSDSFQKLHSKQENGCKTKESQSSEFNSKDEIKYEFDTIFDKKDFGSLGIPNYIIEYDSLNLALRCPSYYKFTTNDQLEIGLNDLDQLQLEMEILLLDTMKRLRLLKNELNPSEIKMLKNNINESSLISPSLSTSEKAFKEKTFEKYFDHISFKNYVNCSQLPPNFDKFESFIQTSYPQLNDLDKPNQFWSFVHLFHDIPLSDEDMKKCAEFYDACQMLDDDLCDMNILIDDNENNTSNEDDKQSIDNDKLEKNIETFLNRQLSNKQESAQQSIGPLTQKLLKSFIEINDDGLPDSNVSIKDENSRKKEEILDSDNLGKKLEKFIDEQMSETNEKSSDQYVSLTKNILNNFIEIDDMDEGDEHELDNSENDDVDAECDAEEESDDNENEDVEVECKDVDNNDGQDGTSQNVEDCKEKKNIDNVESNDDKHKLDSKAIDDAKGVSDDAENDDNHSLLHFKNAYDETMRKIYEILKNIKNKKDDEKSDELNDSKKSTDDFDVGENIEEIRMMNEKMKQIDEKNQIQFNAHEFERSLRKILIQLDILKPKHQQQQQLKTEYNRTISLLKQKSLLSHLKNNYKHSLNDYITQKIDEELYSTFLKLFKTFKSIQMEKLSKQQIQMNNYYRFDRLWQQRLQLVKFLNLLNRN